MVNEVVNAVETVSVQLIRGTAPAVDVTATLESTINGCGMPSITMDREVFGINVKGENNDNKN